MDTRGKKPAPCFRLLNLTTEIFERKFKPFVNMYSEWVHGSVVLQAIYLLVVHGMKLTEICLIMLSLA